MHPSEPLDYTPVAQFEYNTPDLASKLFTRAPEPEGPPAPPQSSGERSPWTVWGFGGVPIQSNWGDSTTVGHPRGHIRNPYTYSEGSSPSYGARLQYDIKPYLAAAIEMWRSQQKSKVGTGPEDSYKFWTDQVNASPSLMLKAPMGDVTPYVGGGPVWTRTEMGDHIGSSPPSIDFGFQGYGGAQFNMDKFLEGLRGMVEAKYHRSRVMTTDGEGTLNGRLGNTALMFGLGYQFGKGSK